MGIRWLSVGTTPVIAIQSNVRRVGWKIIFIASSIESANTGRVHLQKGAPPSSTLGTPNQGGPMLQGDQQGESENFANDKNVYKGDIWLIASAADQRVWIDEAIDENP